MDMIEKGFKAHKPITGAKLEQKLNPVQERLLKKS